MLRRVHIGDLKARIWFGVIDLTDHILFRAFLLYRYVRWILSYVQRIALRKLRPAFNRAMEARARNQQVRSSRMTSVL